MKHYIIYIPGLGDNYDTFRRFLLFFWRVFGVKTILVPMQWYDGASYDEKYAKVEAAVEAAQKKGYTVSLIGESAGASIAINVFARNQSIHRLISLCGVNTGRTPISSRIFNKSNAFKKSVSSLRPFQDEDRLNRVVSVTALSDPTVPVEKNIIPGAKHIKVWSVGHFTTITLCLSLFSFILVCEVKRSA